MITSDLKLNLMKFSKETFSFETFSSFQVNIESGAAQMTEVVYLAFDYAKQMMIVLF